MSILLIGSNGLIGTQLMKYLRDNTKGDVIGFSSRYPSSPVEGCIYEQGDVTEYGTLNRVMKKYGVKRVIHNAAISSPRYFADNPHKIFRVNVQGTLTALEAAKNFDVERFVYISSTAVYGAAVEEVLHEDYPRRAADAYGASKIACEEIVRNYQIPTISLRVGFVYGPGRVIACPIRDMVGEIIKTGGVHWKKGADQLHDFIYIDDVVKGIYEATMSDAGIHAEYNMSGGNLVSFRRIADKIQTLYPEAKIDIGSGDMGLLPVGAISYDKTFKTFGWKPEYSIEQGLEKYVPWLDKVLRERE